LSRKRTSWMVLTAERITARTALDWGLINECVPPSELMPRAEELARRISQFDPAALTAAKKALDTIPATITNWRQSFQFGQLINAEIQQRSSVKNPLS